MKIDDQHLVNAYIFYRELINDHPNKHEFEYCGHIIQLSPDVCLDLSLKWHIKIKIGDEYHLIGACSVLWDVQCILSERYIEDILKTKDIANANNPTDC